jgi:DNA polymerase-3 subunit epsilon
VREIVFDTETTGLDPYQGHRLIEIGCYELLNRIPSGQTFHRYLNPERDVPAEAAAIHGITADLAPHPGGDACGIIHQASDLSITPARSRR